jgi:hypothetical protein
MDLPEALLEVHSWTAFPQPRRLHEPLHHTRHLHRDGRHRLAGAITALDEGELPCSGGEGH